MGLEGWFAAEFTVCPGNKDGPGEVSCPSQQEAPGQLPGQAAIGEAPNATLSARNPQRPTLQGRGQGWEFWADIDHHPSTKAGR